MYVLFSLGTPIEPTRGLPSLDPTSGQYHGTGQKVTVCVFCVKIANRRTNFASRNTTQQNTTQHNKCKIAKSTTMPHMTIDTTGEAVITQGPTHATIMM